MQLVQIEQIQVNNVEKRTAKDDPSNFWHNQFVWLYQPGSQHPLKIRIRLPEGITSYPAGFYLFNSMQSIVADKYDAPSFPAFSGLQLSPIFVSESVALNPSPFVQQYYGALEKASLNAIKAAS
jgi:hypothetical protein